MLLSSLWNSKKKNIKHKKHFSLFTFFTYFLSLWRHKASHKCWNQITRYSHKQRCVIRSFYKVNGNEDGLNTYLDVWNVSCRNSCYAERHEAQSDSSPEEGSHLVLAPVFNIKFSYYLYSYLLNLYALMTFRTLVLLRTLKI